MKSFHDGIRGGGAAVSNDENQMNKDKEVENLCRWAAARAGAIVVAPGIGTMALVANEVYMIIRIGKVYDKNISQSAAAGFLVSLGAAFAGQTLATLLPFPPLQIAIGVSVTYAVGKAAQAWIKAEMPSELKDIRRVFADAKKTAKSRWKDFSAHPNQDVPLGDEATEILLLAQGEQNAANAGEGKVNNDKGKERLKRLANLKEEIARRIDKLPFGGEIAGPVMDYIFNETHVKQVLDAIKNPRPLRIVFVGCTGAGKSSVINALAGKYLAEVSDSVPGQQQAEKHCIMDGDRVLFEVVDTRGIADAGPNGEAELEKAMRGFEPDIMMLAIPLTGRSHIDDDLRAVNDIRQRYFNGAIPLVVLLTKADQMAPVQEAIESDRKQLNIKAFSDRVAGLIQVEGLKSLAVLPVCSYIDWTEDKVQMLYDSRYNIEKLQELIIENVALDAALQLAFEGRTKFAVKMVADRFVHACAALAGSVGVNPLPVADIALLTSLQVIMVTTVAYLGGRDLDEDGVKEFIAGLGFHIPTALALREVARVLAPIFGGAVSGTIAAGGTYAIGVSSVAYYVEGKPRSALSDIFKAAQGWVYEKIKREGLGWFK